MGNSCFSNNYPIIAICTSASNLKTTWTEQKIPWIDYIRTRYPTWTIQTDYSQEIEGHVMKAWLQLGERICKHYGINWRDPPKMWLYVYFLENALIFL